MRLTTKHKKSFSTLKNLTEHSLDDFTLVSKHLARKKRKFNDYKNHSDFQTVDVNVQVCNGPKLWLRTKIRVLYIWCSWGSLEASQSNNTQKCSFQKFFSKLCFSQLSTKKCFMIQGWREREKTTCTNVTFSMFHYTQFQFPRIQSASVLPEIHNNSCIVFARFEFGALLLQCFFESVAQEVA